MNFWLSKLSQFYRSKGLVYTLRRCAHKLGDLTYIGSYVFFYADLTRMIPKEDVLPAGISIECCKCEGDILEHDRKVFSYYIREKELQRNMKERFTKGALLWLVRVGGHLAGYIWTIRGTTIEPYVRLLTVDDVHLFDNLIFEDFRGQGINPILVNYVLSEMQKQNCVRAFIETRMTNIAEFRSLAKTNFIKYGLAKKRLPWRRRHFGVWQRCVEGPHTNSWQESHCG
jgi:ribosomal protein S18 acetylase RimI-like enzyme